MKKILLLTLGVLSMNCSVASAQEDGSVPVVTNNGLSVAMAGADTISVFGVTNAYDVKDNSFAVLSCVVPKGVEIRESGLCYSTQEIPDYKDNRIVFAKKSRVHTAVLCKLQAGMVYYYRAYVVYEDGRIAYGKIFNAKTIRTLPLKKEVNGHTFVNLGLSSELYWATCNVGAETETDYGNYYAWGEVSVKDNYNAENSTWYMKQHEGNLTGTEDAATANWGEGVRMPTLSEMSELEEQCTWIWQTKYNGTSVNGYLVTGSNGQSIFLPAAGSYGTIEGNVLYDDGLVGSYWTSSPDSSYDGISYMMYFKENYHSTYNYFNRKIGLPVRAVCR